MLDRTRAQQGLQIALGQASDRGRKAVNQDFHGACIPAEPQVGLKGIALALADGISSSSVSHIASQTAVTGFLVDYYSTPDAWSVRQSAQRVLAATSSWLYSQTRQSEHRYDNERGYVCTFSALIIKSATAYLFHVGDSRIYRLRGGELEQLTRDHRLRVAADTSYLARALGISQHLEIDHKTLAVEQGDMFMLATDGLYEFVGPATLARVIEAHGDDLDSAARSLLDHALAQGSADNLTVQLLRVDALPTRTALEFSQHLTELPPAPLLESRAQFEGFTIERELHASSRSHVYLATDNASAERVILKVPSIDLREDQAYLERLMLEEWVARRIHDPHVLKAAAQTRSRGYLYTVSQYLEGQTLRQWMLDHPRPDLQAVRNIIEQIARGLRAFHRLDMLHQDLRPQNIMIDPVGTVTIIDFGSVSVAGLDEMQSDNTALILGTRQYTAPEYFLGYPGTAQSDLFSLGVIAYQLLSGQLPYGTEVAQATSRAAQLRLKYRTITRYRQDLPLWLDEVLKGAVQPDPNKRYAALSEFTFALCQPDVRLLSRQSPPLLERNPVVFWQGVSLALVVLLVLVLLWSGRG
ncbi:serine/threonine protein kinase [Halopseudomonas litoralis]|uniref:Serine/threonine protein kinase n=1 Tax=Halopseudomonas litoralis TaxID=797277 RepID=A0A1H1MKD9_9GAMM|nr:bifunctional protein-serine/threonine kinase/phosphatase [Halopseudomonas litoralis]SDR87311.1 serine/threonine protein kinase [Halopseudomonas litoralis]